MKKNINLKNKNLLKRSFFTASLSTNLGVIVLVVTFLIYGVFFIANNLIEKNIKKVNVVIKSIEESLVGDQFSDVYNFGVKLIDLERQVGKDEFLPHTRNLLKISEKTFDEIVFHNMKVKYEGGIYEYEISFVVPNYEMLANQIKIYKETEYIHNVVLRDVKEENENNEILASLSFGVGDLERVSVDSFDSEEKDNF